MRPCLKHKEGRKEGARGEGERGTEREGGGGEGGECMKAFGMVDLLLDVFS